MAGALSILRREAVWAFLLLVAAYSALKGAVFTPQLWGQVNWFATYEHGFMRRGLAGTVFHGLFGGTKPGVYQLGIVYQHHLTVALLVVAMVVALRFAARRSGDYIAIALAGLVVCASQALPHLSYDVGYLDPHILLLLGIGVFALAVRWIWLAAVVAAIAPLVHEQFIFWWLPIVAAHFVVNVGLDRQSMVKAAVANLAVAGPAIATALVAIFFQNSEAVRQAISLTPIEPEQRLQLARQTFDQTISSAITYMGGVWAIYGATGVAALVAYALVPGLLLCWLAARAFRHLGRPAVVWTILLIGTFGCLLILVVAWDLSRFATLPMFMWAATVALIASRAPREREAEETKPTSGVVPKALAALAIVAGLVSPFVFAYFSSTYIVRGPYQVVASPLEEPAKDLLHAEIVTP